MSDAAGDKRENGAGGAAETASRPVAGLHGKMPAYGDFLTRGLPGSFVKQWDDWMKRALAEARQTLGPNFLDVYLKAPPWRYLLGQGVVGAEPWGGLVLAATDKVGRCYPLTLGVKLPPLADTAAMLRVWAAGFDGLEEIGLSLLDESMTIDDATTALQRLMQDRPLPMRGVSPVWPERGRTEAWSLPIDDLGPSMVHHLLMGSTGPASFWWHEGMPAEATGPAVPVPARAILFRGMPPAGGFAAMLGADWRASGWSGDGAVSGAADGNGGRSSTGRG